MRPALLVLVVVVAWSLLRPRSRSLMPPAPGARGGAGGGPRTRERGARPPTDPVTVVDLIALAVEAGAPVPHAVAAVGAVLADPAGADLRRAAGALQLGAPWAAAWSGSPEVAAVLAPLEAAWTTGAPAGPALRSAAAELRRDRERAAREAAGRLGVRLVLPLGLCFLPAFVLVGLVPVLVSLAGALLR